METFSALLAICAGNSPASGEFPTQRPVTRSFEVFFDLRPNKRLSKQCWGWWFGTPSSPLRRHCNEMCWKRLYVLMRVVLLTQKYPHIGLWSLSAFFEGQNLVDKLKIWLFVHHFTIDDPHFDQSVWGNHQKASSILFFSKLEMNDSWTFPIDNQYFPAMTQLNQYRTNPLCITSHHISSHCISSHHIITSSHHIITLSNHNQTETLALCGMNPCHNFNGGFCYRPRPRPRRIPRTKASDAELWCFLWSAPE